MSGKFILPKMTLEAKYKRFKKKKNRPMASKIKDRTIVIKIKKYQTLN